jgi:hypothetical protein
MWCGVYCHVCSIDGTVEVIHRSHPLEFSSNHMSTATKPGNAAPADWLSILPEEFPKLGSGRGQTPTRAATQIATILYNTQAAPL